MKIDCLCAQGASEDFDNSNPELDAYYQRGSFLVYDCVRNHWVCTKELEFKRCIKGRKKALLDYNERLPCSYFDQYKSDALCIKEQVRLTNEARGDRFCMHPSLKGLLRNY